MATVLLKQTDLKFNKQSFRELDAPNLFINLWTYNYFKKHKSRFACDTYSRYCEEILKEIWRDDFFESVVEKSKSCNKTFINISNYSTRTKWGIIDELINKKWINCKNLLKNRCF